MKALFISILLILLVTGCTIFKTSVQDQLLPLEMTPVSGGAFMMGDLIFQENDDSIPIHEVNLPDFKIGTYEVTYDQYDAFAIATDRKLPRDDERGRGSRAVAFVNWYDAREFCRAYGYDLPTEQQWEYAARAGGKETLYSGTNERDELKNYARYADNSGGYSFWVGSKKPNELGIYDMSGNVAEWIGEWYAFYQTEVDSTELYPLKEKGMRVIRGGSFRHSQNILRNYWRVGVLVEAESYFIGFRCATSITNS